MVIAGLCCIGVLFCAIVFVLFCMLHCELDSDKRISDEFQEEYLTDKYKERNDEDR